MKKTLHSSGPEDNVSEERLDVKASDVPVAGRIQTSGIVTTRPADMMLSSLEHMWQG